MEEMRKAVVSVLGVDRKGIIAHVSAALLNHDANILDISQTIVSGLFTMILIADISSDKCNFDALSGELHTLGENLGLQIRIQRGKIFDAMHQV